MKIENLDIGIGVFTLLAGLIIGALLSEGVIKSDICSEAQDKGFVLYHCRER